MENHYDTLMEKFDQRLKQETWFSDGWMTQWGTTSKGGAVFQLYKQAWFNDDGMGIHFETWFGDKEWETRKIRIVMHVLHQSVFPSTKLKRSSFSTPFRENARELVQSWKKYKLSNSTMKVLSCDLRFEHESLVDILIDEFGRIQELGTIVDRVIREEIIVTK